MREAICNRIPRKLAYIEWLAEQRRIWAALNNHDGYLNSPEREESFMKYLEDK